MSPSTPPPNGSPASNEPPPATPDLEDLLRPPAGLGSLGLDRLGLTQAIGGLALGLIALYGLRPATPTPPMTTSVSPDAPSSSSSNWASPSSLPRWRLFLSTLNWRRDPGYEQRKMQHEWRMKQLDSDLLLVENEILRVRNDSEQIDKDIEQIKKETEQIENETEQLRQENARGKQLLAKIDALCFAPESSSIPPSPTEAGSRPSWR